jgi:type I restriction enzyme S subunit
MEYRLKEILQDKGYIRGPFGSSLKRNELKSTGIPVYEQQHAIYATREFRYYIDEEKYSQMKRFTVKPKDLIISCSGTIGKVDLISEKDPIGIISQALLILRANTDIVLPEYLFYFFKSDYGYNSIISRSMGSVQVNIAKREVIENIKINIPSLKEQEKIVKILSNIDEKIKLNNQINDNLYKMMKIKFEDWITNLNKYEVSSLSKIANYTNGLAMQKFRPKDNEESLPVIKIKEMNDGITENTERCSTNIKDEVIINNGDVLFAWSGTLCMSIWGKGKAGLNQHIFKVTSDKYPKWFYYFWTLKHLNKFKMIAAGKATTMGHIKRGELDISEVLIPEDKELQEMHKIMQPLFNKYINNLIQNETLTQLRDTLLPKLMNGEIDLDKIEN